MYYTILTNQYPGLARGPIDHQSSSVINSIANGAITMGSVIVLKDLVTPLVAGEILPRVEESSSGVITDDNYGIVVGGDVDGIYGDGAAASDDSTRAATGAGQGVVVVTQGRCLARVDGTTVIAVGDPLGASDTAGILELADDTSQFVIARALQPVAVNDLDIIAVDVQREGLFT